MSLVRFKGFFLVLAVSLICFMPVQAFAAFEIPEEPEYVHDDPYGLMLMIDDVLDFPEFPGEVLEQPFQFIRKASDGCYYLLSWEYQFAFQPGRVATYSVDYGDALDTFLIYKLDSDFLAWTLDTSYSPYGKWGDNVQYLTTAHYYSGLVWSSHQIVDKSDSSSVLYEAGEQAGFDLTIGGEDASGGLPGSPSGSGDYAGFLGTIITWLQGISNGVGSLVSTVGDFFGNFFENLLDFLIHLVVPEEGFLDDTIALLNAEISAVTGINFDSFDISGIVGTGGWADDSDFLASLKFGNDRVSWSSEDGVLLFNSSYLLLAISTFRPVIRGFLVLMTLFFIVNQILSMFGFAGVTVAGPGHYQAYSEAWNENNPRSKVGFL